MGAAMGAALRPTCMMMTKNSIHMFAGLMASPPAATVSHAVQPSTPSPMKTGALAYPPHETESLKSPSHGLSENGEAAAAEYRCLIAAGTAFCT